MQSSKQIQKRACSSSGHEPSCVDCHFLMKWDRKPPVGDVKLPIAHDERSRLARSEPPEKLLGENYSIACYHNVWDWANRRKDSEKDLVRVLTSDRGETCFFYPHTPGMFFPAAAELERREASRREARRDRQLTKRGILITVVAAVICVVLGAVLTKALGECFAPAPTSTRSRPS